MDDLEFDFNFAAPPAAAPAQGTGSEPSPPPSSSSAAQPSVNAAKVFAEHIGRDHANVDRIWNVAGWQSLVNFASQSSDASFARLVFERCLKLFPYAAGVWLSYLRWEKQQGGSGSNGAIETLLGRCLSTSVAPELWLFYVEHILRTQLEPAEAARANARAALESATSAANEEVGTTVAAERKAAAEVELANAAQAELQARSVVLEATELSLKTVGDSYHAGPLWELFIDLHKRAPEGTAYEVSQKRDLLRKAYHRAVAVPHAAAPKLWQEYQDWEKANSPAQLASALIDNRTTNASTASAVAGELALLWTGIDRFALACPPTSECVEAVFPPPPAATAGAASSSGKAGASKDDLASKAKGTATYAHVKTAAQLLGVTLDQQAQQSSSSAAMSSKVSHSSPYMKDQLERWHRLKAYQRTNPAMVELGANVRALRLIYKQSIACFRFMADQWLEYALFEEVIAKGNAAAAFSGTSANNPSSSSSSSTAGGSHKGGAAAAATGSAAAPSASADASPAAAEANLLSILQEAVALLPTCTLLVTACADMLQLHKQAALGKQCHENHVAALTAMADVHTTAANATAANAAASKGDKDSKDEEDAEWKKATTPAPPFSLEEAWLRLDAFDLALTSPLGSVTAISFPSRAEAAGAAQALTHAYILLMRYARRTAGIEAGRAVFGAARKSRYLSPLMYLAAAHSEYFSNKNKEGLAVARNILEAGRKRFPRDLTYALSILDFLAIVDDETNVRAVFEAVLSDLPIGDSRPVWDRYIGYELRMASGGGSLAAVISLEAKRAAIFPHLAASSGPLGSLIGGGGAGGGTASVFGVNSLTQLLHRSVEFGCPPLTRYDLDLLRRQQQATASEKAHQLQLQQAKQQAVDSKSSAFSSSAGPFGALTAVSSALQLGLQTSSSSSSSSSVLAPSYLQPSAVIDAPLPVLSSAAITGGMLATPALSATSVAGAASSGMLSLAQQQLRDGLFPQVRSLLSEPLSHVSPYAAVLASRAAVEEFEEVEEDDDDNDDDDEGAQDGQGAYTYDFGETNGAGGSGVGMKRKRRLVNAASSAAAMPAFVPPPVSSVPPMIAAPAAGGFGAGAMRKGAAAFGASAFSAEGDASSSGGVAAAPPAPAPAAAAVDPRMKRARL